MNKLKLLQLITLLFSMINSALAQEIIPFRLNNHHNILVKAIINEVDSVELMFQIAMQEGSLAPDRKNPVQSVKFDSTEFPEGLSKVNQIKVANTIIDSVWIWNNEYTGPEAEGKIGTLLFQGKIFKINYSQSQFELYDKLPTLEGYHKIPIKTKNGQLFLQLTSMFGDQPSTDEFLMQSGFSGAILYNNQFADTNQLAQKLPVLEEKTMTNSAGQKLSSLICLMPEIKIDSFTFKEVPVSLFTGEIKNQKTNYIGADLIHRFNWVIDVKGGYAYIQRNEAFSDKYYFQKIK
ncbi:hypothetical protein [Sphingobacterium cellulitidis]|nr:hypothetical protein [Sphingobacterium soli]MBA8986594.1 hypothetical protein [Sphingobacterium soli]